MSLGKVLVPWSPVIIFVVVLFLAWELCAALGLPLSFSRKSDERNSARKRSLFDQPRMASVIPIQVPTIKRPHKTLYYSGVSSPKASPQRPEHRLTRL
jgi:hypothetical protein